MNAPGSTAVTWRRDLHVHSEVGFTEFRTASRVAGALADLGWDVITGRDAMSVEHRLGVPAPADLDAAYAPRRVPPIRGSCPACAAGTPRW